MSDPARDSFADLILRAKALGVALHRLRTGARLVLAELERREAEQKEKAH